jgi:hypothetical protein
VFEGPLSSFQGFWGFWGFQGFRGSVDTLPHDDNQFLLNIPDIPCGIESLHMGIQSVSAELFGTEELCYTPRGHG